jgi:hypothetical protein
MSAKFNFVSYRYNNIRLEIMKLLIVQFLSYALLILLYKIQISPQHSLLKYLGPFSSLTESKTKLRTHIIEQEVTL